MKTRLLTRATVTVNFATDESHMNTLLLRDTHCIRVSQTSQSTDDTGKLNVSWLTSFSSL